MRRLVRLAYPAPAKLGRKCTMCMEFCDGQHVPNEARDLAQNDPSCVSTMEQIP